MNIPTAEEIYLKYTQCVMNHGDIKTAMIEFAKLHVQAALKDASEKSTVIRDEEFYTISHVNKNSILNAYPLTNIK